jgi:hypothetical protein
MSQAEGKLIEYETGFKLAAVRRVGAGPPLIYSGANNN